MARILQGDNLASFLFGMGWTPILVRKNHHQAESIKTLTKPASRISGFLSTMQISRPRS